MRHKDCLNDRELILHYYAELADDSTQKQHLTSCTLCAERLDSLSHGLSQLPALRYEPDDFAGARMAAKVANRIKQPRPNRLIPAIGISVATAVIILTTFINSPQQQALQLAQVEPSSVTNFEIEESMPDIDFLEDLELLQELELLAQIEGV